MTNTLFDFLETSLMECEILTDVNTSVCNSYNNIYYSKVIDCNMILDSAVVISIAICIPGKWQQELIDIYISNYDEFDFIPHVDSKGKLCLFEKEGILIDQNLVGITIQSLFRAKDILEDGLTQKNKMDFIDEFELYWGQLSNCRLTYFVVPKTHKSQKIKYISNLTAKRKNERHIEYINRIRNKPLYVAKETGELKRWRLENSPILNAIYFAISPQIYVFPPDIRNNINIDYLNNLLSFVPKDILTKLIYCLGRQKVIVFEIKQPNGIINHLGFYFENGCFSKKNFNFQHVNNLQPLIIHRADKKYLMSRTAEKDLDNNKYILVIGCGSIGGYLINELAKQGYENLTIVDSDILSNENIFRHILGLEYVLKNKSDALKEYICKNIPEMNIQSINEKIEDVLLYDEINLNKFDLIISTTGNHNVNRWLNTYVCNHKLYVPIIYAWNEVCGIGNHVAYFKYGNVGCYECLFGRNDDTGELYDKTSYCKFGQKITKTVYGCDKSFVPYGNMISLKTVLICMDIIKDILKGKTLDNFILSVKGNYEYFKEQGFEVSDRYINQKENVKKITGSQFVNPMCGVCKDDCPK